MGLAHSVAAFSPSGPQPGLFLGQRRFSLYAGTNGDYSLTVIPDLFACQHAKLAHQWPISVDFSLSVWTSRQNV